MADDEEAVVLACTSTSLVFLFYVRTRMPKDNTLTICKDYL